MSKNKDSRSLRFLYHTVPGRFVLKLLTRPSLSILAGAFLDSPLSRPLIEPFARSQNISLEGVMVPEKGFPSFNEFFSRRRVPGSFSEDPAELISPCDGWLSYAYIDNTSTFRIKHSRYTIPELLGVDAARLLPELTGGLALIFRLTPADYHRYIFPDNGKVLSTKKIPGRLHTVRPIATESTNVYVQNSREYAVVQTENFGTVVQMEVGALLVGRICNHAGLTNVTRGTEKGFFQYGGSTIILLLPKNSVQLPSSVRGHIGTGEEFQVKMGQVIGLRGEKSK